MAEEEGRKESKWRGERMVVNCVFNAMAATLLARLMACSAINWRPLINMTMCGGVSGGMKKAYLSP